MNFNRILLKLSGEALMGDRTHGIDPERINEYAEEIKQIYDQQIEIAIVIGGGNIFRGVSGASNGMDRVQGEYMGMLATVINGMALQGALENKGIDAAWDLITDYINHTNNDGYFTKKRQEQNAFWLLQTIEDQLKDRFFQDETIAKELKTQMALIADNKRSPFAVAEYLLNLHKTGV